MKISIVSLFRDEAKYLKEWIEFHLLVGVDEFHLVNNNSSDNYLDILDKYIKLGIVKLYDINVETKNNVKSFSNEQILVRHWVNKLNEIVLNSTDDWMIHVSTDEFLFPTENENIKDVLKNFDNNVGEISVNWTLFGNSKIILSDNDLLIEKLTKSSVSEWGENFHVKPIFKPKAVLRVPSVHFTQLKPQFIKVDATGNSQNFRNMYEVKNRVLSPLHINHYRLRDLAWTHRKIEIYELWGRTNQAILLNSYNDVENLNVKKFVDKLKIKIQSN
jgi:hypothetical protein